MSENYSWQVRITGRKLLVEPLANANKLVTNYLLKPWQMSEKWSICKLTSSPIRPPSPPPPPSWPILTTLKQRANIENALQWFSWLFFGVNIAKEEKDVMHSERAVDHCVCFLLVWDEKSTYNIHGCLRHLGRRIPYFGYVFMPSKSYFFCGI